MTMAAVATQFCAQMRRDFVDLYRKSQKHDVALQPQNFWGAYPDLSVEQELWKPNGKHDTQRLGDCCVAHLSKGCKDLKLAACVCAIDAYCCRVAWDVQCTMALKS